MRVHAATVLPALVALALGGCATYTGSDTGKPEVVFQSNGQPPSKIVRTTTAHYYETFTPEGNRAYPRDYDHHYALQDPDGTTTALRFLDVRKEGLLGPGIVSAVFDVGGNWVALSERFGAWHLRYSHDHGWYGDGPWQRDLTAKVFVKTFSRTALLHDTELDVCNPSNAANPPVLFDEANAVLRYCNREGIQLYFPLTGTKKLERSALCCHDSSQGGSRRDWKDFYQRTAG